ncbi:MAG: exonuclease SbcCD subunit D [Chloroflexi bacterium]|nr:exonuclease SbcCD subunit D [Chloroflexota bacterium]
MNQKSIRILHFADAHIDMANYGRHDPNTALPVRVGDFLKALDQIVDTAVAEKVDFVLFAGDAYKDRNPQPTFQREWGRRMMRLSEAGIPTLLLVGNHDVAPASGRAHTLQEFTTLAVPNIFVGDTIKRFTPDELGIPLQVITVPWVSRSRMLTREDMAGLSLTEVLTELEERVQERVTQLIETADPDIPLILTAHASIQGAKFGSERQVMLGHELTLSGSLVNNKKIDYVALGHIHKHQSLHAKDAHPPIVYPGSIERIDFGEIREKKGFVLAEISRGDTLWEFATLKTRRFLDFTIEPRDADNFMADVMEKLPDVNEVEGAICRVQVRYPRDWEPLLDESAIAERFKSALSFQILKHRDIEKRARLGDTLAVESLTPQELLSIYWDSTGLEQKEAEAMQLLAKEVLGDVMA